jgi:hypothetical protein
MVSGRIAAAATLVGLALALSGCGSSEPSLSDEQLKSLVREDDQIDRRDDDPELVWEPVMLEARILTMAAMLESLLIEWQDNAAAPDECFESFVVTWGAASDGHQTDDRAGQLVFFSNAAERGNRITVDARTFDTAADATALLDGLPAVFAACPHGYTYAGAAVATDGFVVEELDAPDGLRIVRVDGGVEPDGFSARTVLIQSGRDIVIVDAILFDSDTNLDEIDAYARILAERIAAIRVS